jgi:hypothetical protein
MFDEFRYQIFIFEYCFRIRIKHYHYCNGKCEMCGISYAILFLVFSFTLDNFIVVAYISCYIDKTQK